MTSKANDLTERLRRRLETERRTIEELTASELEQLGARLRPLMVGLSLWLGICGGSWATMHWLSTRIQARIQTAAALDLDIEEARQTLARLEETTWGIALREIEGERFVVLPTGALAYPLWTVGTRPAVKMSSE